MKKIVFIGAVAILAIACSGKAEDKKATKTTVENHNVQTGDLKIAYYVLDSLATSFEIYKSEQEAIEKEGQALSNQMQNMQNEYQKEYARYESGMKTQSLTPNQAASFEQRLGSLQQRMGEFQNTKLAAFQEKQYKATESINNKIIKYAKEFGEENKLSLFLAAGSQSNVSYANPGLDMTVDFVEYMNQEEKKLGE